MQFLQKIFLLIIMVATGRDGLSQWRHDAHFVMGYWSGDLAKDPVLQFGADSVSISYQRLALEFDVSSANISNRDGDLLFYFNGCSVANAYNEIIENGTGFNPGQVATWHCSENYAYTSGHQSSMIIPLDTIDKQFMVLHHTKEIYTDNDTIYFYGIPRYSIVDMHANDGRGKVTIKNQIYLPDSIIGGSNLSAVKHNNGKDWWIVVLDSEGSNNYYRVLLRDGKLILMGNQEIGNPWLRIGGGQAGFNLDGNKYFTFSSYDGLAVMDFDRESGLFSNYRHLGSTQQALFNGAQFSPNGRFVYLSNGPTLVQIDTEADELVADTIAIWDGKTATWGQPAYFGYMQTGPDCRIYMTTGYCVPFIHVIMEPDLKGKDCDVRQHFFELNVPTCNLPYFPNYRLGTGAPYCNRDIKVISPVQDIFYNYDKESLTIYPNPSNDQITIYGSDLHTIQIYSLDGRKLITSEAHGANEHIMNISALQDGLYFIRYTNSKGILSKPVKFIKIK